MKSILKGKTYFANRAQGLEMGNDKKPKVSQYNQRERRIVVTDLKE